MRVVYSRLASAMSSKSPSYWEYFGARLADLAAIPDGARVLDVGTGSGSALLPAAKRAGKYGRGVGVDIDFEWLRHALSGIQSSGLKNIFLAQMDAAHLGFMNSLFDRVLCGFMGWDYCFDFAKLEFTCPDTRLAEISRVLKAGERVGISAWARQDDLDWLGEQFQRNLPAYVASQEKEMGSAMTVYSKENATGLERILRQSGFQDIEIIAETEDFVSTNEEEWWQQVWGAGWWEHIDKVARMDEDKLKQFKEQTFEGLQQYKHNDGIHFRKTVLFAFGKKR
jgi:ubiquinone/menaquinone biosynthesis C-methylase UbiE